MKIYIVLIDNKRVRVPAEGMDQLSEKLFILCPGQEFKLEAINFPNIKMRQDYFVKVEAVN